MHTAQRTVAIYALLAAGFGITGLAKSSA